MPKKQIKPKTKTVSNQVKFKKGLDKVGDDLKLTAKDLKTKYKKSDKKTKQALWVGVAGIAALLFGVLGRRKRKKSKN